jgi:hypothetical protein
MEVNLSDLIVISLVYFVVTAISYWSVYSIFKSIETEDKLSIPLASKIKIALVCSAAYFLPLLFFRMLDSAAFLLYLVIIPIGIIAIKAISKNPISLKSALGLFLGIFAKMVAVAIILGGASRLIVRISQG